MSIYSNSIRHATSWAKSRVDGIEGWPRYIISIGIWSIAILWTLALIVARTGRLLMNFVSDIIKILLLKNRLRKARRAHQAAILAAERDLKKAEREYRKRVAIARQNLDVLRSPTGKKLEKFNNILVYERTITTPKGSYSIIGVKATVETAGNLAVTKRATLTRMVVGDVIAGPVGAVVGGAGFKKTKRLDVRELYLYIEGPTFQYVQQFRPDEGPRVRQFAATINSVASRAAIDEPNRPERILEYERALSLAEGSREQIEQAQLHLDEVTGQAEYLNAKESAKQALESYRSSRTRKVRS